MDIYREKHMKFHVMYINMEEGLENSYGCSSSPWKHFCHFQYAEEPSHLKNCFPAI